MKSFLNNPQLVPLPFGPDKIRKSREYRICIDPDQPKLIDAILKLIEELHIHIKALDRPNDMVLHPLSEIREWDEALAVLGIQDSDQTPADAIRELNAEIERLRTALSA